MRLSDLPPGWTYEGDNKALRDRWREPAVLGRGRYQQIANVVSGIEGGRSFFAFTTPFSGSAPGVRVIVAVDAGRPLPFVHVAVRTYGRLGRSIFARLPRVEDPGARRSVEHFFGIELGDAEFDRRFNVQAHDRSAAEQVLPPRVRAALLAAGQRPLAFQGSDVLSWDILGPFEVAKIRPILGLAVTVASELARSEP
jgi:hypothetical protein